MQDRVSIFDNWQIGQDVEVSFNLRSRRWTNKEGLTSYFNSLTAWKVASLSNQPAQQSQPHYNSMPAPADVSGAEDDDLPF